MGNSVPSGNFELEADAAAAAKNITRTQSSLRVIRTPLVAIGPLTAHEMEFFGTLHPKSVFFIVSSSDKTPKRAISDLLYEAAKNRALSGPGRSADASPFTIHLKLTYV
jgi:hypothetical protein